MKTFEHFVAREFAGSDNEDDMYMSLDEHANAGLYEEIVSKFKNAAEAYKNEYLTYLAECIADKYTIKDYWDNSFTLTEIYKELGWNNEKANK